MTSIFQEIIFFDRLGAPTRVWGAGQGLVANAIIVMGSNMALM